MRIEMAWRGDAFGMLIRSVRSWTARTRCVRAQLRDSVRWRPCAKDVGGVCRCSRSRGFVCEGIDRSRFDRYSANDEYTNDCSRYCALIRVVSQLGL